MGSDNRFHKRKAKQYRDLERQKAKRAPYERILIVCEGGKTEPIYLKGLVKEYGLNTANVEITGDCGSAPINVVDYAYLLYKKDKKSGSPYDIVYCVFDKDTHDSYHQAINKINGLNPKNIFKAIKSIPCFEYWILQHFASTTRAFVSAGNKSPCDCVLHEVNKYLPSYQKGAIDSNAFNQLLTNTQTAINNSKQSIQQAKLANTDNPSTEVHILVEFLLDLKKRAESI